MCPVRSVTYVSGRSPLCFHSVNRASLRAQRSTDFATTEKPINPNRTAALSFRKRRSRVDIAVDMVALLLHVSQVTVLPVPAVDGQHGGECTTHAQVSYGLAPRRPPGCVA